MIRWYCYQTERGREQDAAAQITDRGFRVLAIQQEYQRIIRGAVVACCRQLFPGYGFVQFDVEADPWPRINSARNGVRIVTAGGDAPRPIPIITAQMERERDGQLGGGAADADAE